ncbi:MAG: hypothetical protein LBL01_00310 [Bifidobacteriaceae bacterium]|jgi:hypothetical protein|nr:hypothetical protein [Bifidobacteriaceae bacterium]
MPRLPKIERVKDLPLAEARELRKTHRRVTRGLYLEPGAAANDLPTRARAALAVSPEGSMICGATALALVMPKAPLEITRFATLSPVHVLVPRAKGPGPRRAGITVHRAVQLPAPWPVGAARDRDRPAARPGMPPAWVEYPDEDGPPPWVDASPPAGLLAPLEINAAHPAHCWAQLVLDLLGKHPWRPGDPDEGQAPGTFDSRARRMFLVCVQAGDALVRRDRPVLTHAQFAAAMRGLPRWQGVRAVRDVFGWVRANTDSYLETRLRLLTVDAGFPEPVVNHGLMLAGKRSWLDLSWPSLKIDLEYHGRQHVDQPAQVQADIQRRAELVAAGWTVVEAVWGNLVAPSRLISRLRAAFDAARGRQALTGRQTPEGRQ